MLKKYIIYFDLKQFEATHQLNSQLDAVKRTLMQINLSSN